MPGEEEAEVLDTGAALEGGGEQVTGETRGGDEQARQQGMGDGETEGGRKQSGEGEGAEESSEGALNGFGRADGGGESVAPHKLARDLAESVERANHEIDQRGGEGRGQRREGDRSCGEARSARACVVGRTASL